MPHQDPENKPAVNVGVFEDNFNVLSQIINNYPTSNYTEGNFRESEIETDNSLGTNSVEHVEKTPLTQSFKYYLLILFSSIYLIYGCQNSLLGSAMSDLTNILHTTSENISVALSLKNFVFSISTILVSFSFKIFGNRQFQYGGAVFVIGIITGLTPFMTSFKEYLIAAVFSGFSSAFVDAVTNLIVLELFSLNSKVYMQIAHSAFTFGTIFGPLLVGPFLSKSNSTIPSNTTDVYPITTTLKPFTTTPSGHNDTTTTIDSLTTTINNTISDTIFELDSVDLLSVNESDNFPTRIYIPYSIISGLLILSAILMMTFQVIRPYVPEKRKLFAKQKSKRVIEPLEEQVQDSQASSSSSPEISQSNVSSSSSSNKKTETVCQQINLPKIYYRIFLGLTGLLLSVYSCIDGLTGAFMPYFLSKSELNIAKGDAAYMASFIYMAMATGRLFTIAFALKTTCKILLFFNLSLILIGYITLTYFAVHSIFITWIAMIVIGSGLSSTYPLVLSYIENRIVITNTVQLYLLFAGVLLQIFVPIIIGHFIDTVPVIFTYMNLFLAIVALILMLLIHATDVWKRKLIKKIKDDQANLIEED